MPGGVAFVKLSIFLENFTPRGVQTKHARARARVKAHAFASDCAAGVVKRGLSVVAFTRRVRDADSSYRRSEHDPNSVRRARARAHAEISLRRVLHAGRMLSVIRISSGWRRGSEKGFRPAPVNTAAAPTA